MDNIVNYRFVVPDNYESEVYLENHYKDSYYTSDGFPFCSIDKGVLLLREHIKDLPSTLSYTIYEVANFLDVDEFITAFLDGDVEDDDFIK